ncbi:MAG: methylmalonyl Co-A mutase-associated GTPase MeaB [Negativicutes bacterium]|nr:methylmalonyl Co-A mutase-associated GTPase MeaB [Negativicutes bacterium]
MLNIEAISQGSKRALARAITWVENDQPEAAQLMKALHGQTGRAFSVGITGPPGAGKSSLVNWMVKLWRRQGLRVAVIAVDPTSPFTGGAILGDRIRMADLTMDDGVFIRSMGSRGRLGGIAAQTFAVGKLMDAAGYDIVVIETVGVGQSEVEIVEWADATVLVMVPGLGDDIQAIKAGILEIGDVIAVNKADRDGSDKLVAELEMMLSLAGPRDWRPPIVKTEGTTGAGVEQLVAAIADFRGYFQASRLGEERRRGRIRREIVSMVGQRIDRLLEQTVAGLSGWERLVDGCLAGTDDPLSVAERLLVEMGIGRKIRQPDTIDRP